MAATRDFSSLFSRETRPATSGSLEEAKTRAINKLSVLTKKRKSVPVPPTDPKPVSKSSTSPFPSQKSPDSSYLRSLKLNRNYSEYMKSYSNGKPLTLPSPSIPTVKSTDLFARDEEEERRKILDKERIKRSLQKQQGTDTKKFRKISATRAVLNKEEPIWCARCNVKHAQDFHKKPPSSRPRPQPSFPPVSKLPKPDLIEISSDSGSDLKDFIVDDEEETETNSASKLIRKMFNYDPRKYQDEEDEGDVMEAGIEDILAEERRTAKIGKKEDAEEMRKLMKKQRRE